MSSKDNISFIEELQDDLRGPPVQFTKEEEKKILRRIDIRLIPLLSILYLISFLDRGNVGNARIAGMTEDLHLTGTQYNIALTMFFIPYALFEIPSNIVLKILRPRIWIPTIMLAWGTVMTLMGIVQNYQGLVVARVFLGVAEAGFFPAASFLLTCWYPRHELQLRIGYFYGAGALSGAFSGLLAFAIEKMNGVGGLAGWRWIFILEGLITVVAAMVTPFFMNNDPASARFLSEDEKKFVLWRLQVEQGRVGADTESEEPFKWKYFWAAVQDWKVWLSIVVYWGNAMPIYGFIYTVPVVINELGYSSANAQLLTIPIYVAAVIGTITAAYLSDKYHTRSPFIIGPQLFGAIGFVVVMAIPKGKYPGAVYGSLFIIAIGLYTTITGVVSWTGNNLAGSWKRNIGMAIQISLGNLGGAVGTNIYLEKEAPEYWLGFGFSLGILLCASAVAMALRVALQRINAKRDAMSAEEIHSRYTREELWEMGDASPLFRYTL
ncbi:putative MFS nicotinic acid transporter Tna1 [Rhizodiscina lignyota]|uniref:MFS nicotinic acid transporter Tna1 n=1 Tax=Rhizodiscina lignyota TaxID=1504668 RepID=A0A9P4IMK6_9PEZI|nr:putative MFS nicotinic acid transporter Tna1 [Rhizodiscina lignyota]